MELLLIRKIFSEQTTIGELLIDGKRECYILEDPDRNLNSNMTEDQINQIKVPNNTAIPYGRYMVDITKSVRFGRDLPSLHSVPGYSSVMIQPGNSGIDTSGYLLPGKDYRKNTVLHSKMAFEALYNKILAAIQKGEKVWITIEKSNITENYV